MFYSRYLTTVVPQVCFVRCSSLSASVKQCHCIRGGIDMRVQHRRDQSRELAQPSVHTHAHTHAHTRTHTHTPRAADRTSSFKRVESPASVTFNPLHTISDVLVQPWPKESCTGGKQLTDAAFSRSFHRFQGLFEIMRIGHGGKVCKKQRYNVQTLGQRHSVANALCNPDSDLRLSSSIVPLL